MMTEVNPLNSGYAKTKYFNDNALVVVYALLLLPFMGLAGVVRLLGSTSLVMYQSIAMVLLFALVLFKVRYVPRDRFTWFYLLFLVLILFSTTRQHGFSMGIAVNSLAFFFVVLLIQQDGERILKALALIFAVAIVFNLISLLRYGISDRVSYFVGGKNSFSVFFTPAVFAAMANSYIQRKKVTRLIMLCTALVTGMVLVTGSATGIITVLVMWVAILWMRKHSPNVAVFLIGILVVQAMLVLLIDALSNSVLWIRILNALGKEETLTSRAMIWEEAIEIVKDNWLIGTGRGTEIRYKTSWGSISTMNEAHSFILELFLQGGILGFVLYMVMLWAAVSKLDMKNMLHRIVFMGFMLILVNGLAEAVNNKLFVAIFLGLMNACSNGKIKGKIES